MNNYCEEVYIISLHVTIIIRDYSILLGMFIVKGVRYFYSIGIMKMAFSFDCLVSVASTLIDDLWSHIDLFWKGTIW
mgnify:CR=1 FL=1